MSDKFVDKHLREEDETVEEAKKRIAEEQKSREEKSRERMEMNQRRTNDIVKKNLEASLNAGRI